MVCKRHGNPLDMYEVCAYMFMYIYKYVCLYCIRIYTHVRDTHIHVHIYMSLNIDVCVHTCICLYVYMPIWTYIRDHMYIWAFYVSMIKVHNPYNLQCIPA